MPTIRPRRPGLPRSPGLVRRLSMVFGLVLVLGTGTAGSALATDPVFAPNGIAILGTDPVVYFTEGQAAKGDPAFAHDWNGATWHFVSATNRDRFAVDPELYAPQYGGYCAYAVSQGYTADTDPEAWKIVGGKLYLNYSTAVKLLWQARQDHFIAQADKNWPNLSSAR
jgi:YHS domain-containing protein